VREGNFCRRHAKKIKTPIDYRLVTVDKPVEVEDQNLFATEVREPKPQMPGVQATLTNSLNLTQCLFEGGESPPRLMAPGKVKVGNRSLNRMSGFAMAFKSEYVWDSWRGTEGFPITGVASPDKSGPLRPPAHSFFSISEGKCDSYHRRLLLKCQLPSSESLS